LTSREIDKDAVSAGTTVIFGYITHRHLRQTVINSEEPECLLLREDVSRNQYNKQRSKNCRQFPSNNAPFSLDLLYQQLPYIHYSELVLFYLSISKLFLCCPIINRLSTKNRSTFRIVSFLRLRLRLIEDWHV
jgi:hypothetical protein|tara:strand:- start:804 stop:1202 length:399 start_codon:yes stop_codon:yes gene_type:complete